MANGKKCGNFFLGFLYSYSNLPFLIFLHQKEHKKIHIICKNEKGQI